MGYVHDLWPTKIEDFHNAHSECTQGSIVYMYTYPFLWNTWLYVLQQVIFPFMRIEQVDEIQGVYKYNNVFSRKTSFPRTKRLFIPSNCVFLFPNTIFLDFLFFFFIFFFTNPARLFFTIWYLHTWDFPFPHFQRLLSTPLRLSSLFILLPGWRHIFRFHFHFRAKSCINTLYFLYSHTQHTHAYSADYRSTDRTEKRRCTLGKSWSQPTVQPEYSSLYTKYTQE